MRESQRIIRLGFTFLLVASNFIFSTIGHAGTITSAGSGIAYARSTLGQSFTMPAGATGALTSLTVAGIRGRSPQLVSCVRARIYASSAKTAILETSSNSVCDTDASGSETSGTAAVGAFNFSNTLMLSAGTQYFFELSVTSGATDFWTTQSYNAATGGGYPDGQLFADGSFKPAYDMVFTLDYTEAPDTTAPSFASTSSFSASENVSTSSNVATIRVSESSTLSISAGVDAALFNIIASDSVTAFIRFKSSPDFEVPSDSNSNNVFEITVRAVDGSANAATQAISITVTDLLDTSFFNSFALPGSATSAFFRTTVTITANISVASRVTFKMNGKNLPGCINKITSGSGSSHSATCDWRPSSRGVVTLSAASVPTLPGISSASSNPLSVAVNRRVGYR